MGTVSDAQWHKLLDIIQADCELRTGQFTGPNGKPRFLRKWEEAALEINTIDGAFKSGTQWKDAFHNLKARAKKALNEKISYLGGTGGGGPCEEALSSIIEIYRRTMDICGTVTATGNVAVPHPFEIPRGRNLSSRSHNERNFESRNRFGQQRAYGSLAASQYERSPGESFRSPGRMRVSMGHNGGHDNRRGSGWSPGNCSITSNSMTPHKGPRQSPGNLNSASRSGRILTPTQQSQRNHSTYGQFTTNSPLQGPRGYTDNEESQRLTSLNNSSDTARRQLMFLDGNRSPSARASVATFTQALTIAAADIKTAIDANTVAMKNLTDALFASASSE